MTGGEDEHAAAAKTAAPLPAGLADPRPVVVASTLAWFVAAGVLAVLGTNGTWVWTCLFGGLLGLLGLPLMHWQRHRSGW